jgi:CRP/FNR family cyclic AMP-dependent transcriptional regulator
MDAERLKKLPLFEDLSHKELERIAIWADDLDVPEGKHLTEEGAFAHEFFVIEEGTAEVEHEGKVIAELGPGDYFGELALLEHQRRQATVIAITPLRVVVMFQREFEAMDIEMPEVTERIRATMAERKRRIREAERA